MTPILRLLPLLAALTLAAPLQARTLDLEADEALVIDAETGAELLAKDADRPAPPASMLKLMTLNMVFEALEEGRLSLDDEFLVSEKAWRMGGSKMFVRVDERVSIENLIRGVIVLSGNDACVVLAEGLAGSEEEFARRMTERARELGMEGASFGNSTGWPDPANQLTPRNLVFLAERIIERFPDYYEYFAETDFEWGGVAQRNRNPLLYANLGADGLKTGHTEEAGYGLVGSAIRDGRRIIFMIGGLGSTQARAQESERIVEWAFREFKNETLYSAGQSLGRAQVWLGAQPDVGLTVAEDALATVPFGAKMTATLRYEGPLEAPVEKGAHVADLVIEGPEMSPITLPVVAAEDVAKGNYLVRLRATAGMLAQDLIGGALGDREPEPVDGGS